VNGLFQILNVNFQILPENDMSLCPKPEIESVKGLMTLAILILFILGCAPHPAMTPAQMAAQPSSKDALAVGDVVEVKFLYTPQFNETQIIGSDGTIMLQLAGEVKAAGKTKSELRSDLTKLYRKVLNDPEVAVITRKQAQRRVFVGGEVNKPGAIEMPGQLTAMQAIMEAGGFNMVTASTKYVLVIRQKDGDDYGCAIDMRGALDGMRSTPFKLEPMDVVWVPRSGINQVNQWIDQYINKVVPQMGATAFYPMGPAHLGRIGIDTTGIRTAPR
jgi:polysaccharide biosynthesis/export protein